MRIRTILNRVEDLESFVYGRARLGGLADGPAPVVDVRPRKDGRPYRSGCGRRGRSYDRPEEGRFEFAPPWGSSSTWPIGCVGSTADAAG